MSNKISSIFNNLLYKISLFKDPKLDSITPTKEEFLNIIELSDKFEYNPTKMSKFNLWSYINGIYPETTKGDWELKFINATKLKIIQTKR